MIMADTEAFVKLLAIELGLEHFDEQQYNQAIMLAVASYELARKMAAADVVAEGEHHTSPMMAPVAAAFAVAAHVAGYGRFHGGPGAAGAPADPGAGVGDPEPVQAGTEPLSGPA
jgi:hypothetical protein